MFNLGNIVNEIETKRRVNLRLANHSKSNNIASNPKLLSNRPKMVDNRPKIINNRPKMVDKGTMTEITTRSIQTDTIELEKKVKELAVLEKFKKAQQERIDKAKLMNSFLGPPKSEIFEAEDE